LYRSAKPGNLRGMAHEDVLNWLAAHAPDISVIVPGVSTATVAEAAAALGVEPGRIAKTLAMRVNGEALLLVTRQFDLPGTPLAIMTMVYYFAGLVAEVVVLKKQLKKSGQAVTTRASTEATHK
jgi:hypothetical protein